MTRHPRVIRDTYGEQPMVNVDVAIYVAYEPQFHAQQMFDDLFTRLF